MTDKELRRLRRDDLLQILIRQQREIDELTEALTRARAEVERRDIAIGEAGSVAEAALKLNGVFEAAQAAADQYGAQMRERADQLESDARKQSEEARRVADDVLRNARAEAERILRDARAEAETMRRPADAQPAPQTAQAEPRAEDERRHGLFRRSKKA